MDRVERRVATEVLHTQGTIGYHVIHELYRVAHHNREGLTDKEYAFLMARQKTIEAELAKLSKLINRLRRHG